MKMIVGHATHSHIWLLSLFPMFPVSFSFQKRSKGYVKIAQNAKDALATRRKKKPLKT